MRLPVAAVVVGGGGVGVGGVVVVVIQEIIVVSCTYQSRTTALLVYENKMIDFFELHVF